MIASARPPASPPGGSVSKHTGSQKTARGCKKRPARFLPALKFTAVFPPTAESTAASKVVGS